MFWKKKEPYRRDSPLPLFSPPPPDPKDVPAAKFWRVEQTDGRRTIEAHEYEKNDRYVTFYRWVGSEWFNAGNERVNGELVWRYRFEREVVCELNHDYIMAIEESI